MVSNMMCDPFWKTGSLAVGFIRKNDGLKFFPVIGFTWYEV